MEGLMGGELTSSEICGIAIGIGLVFTVASGGWSLVGASMFCSISAY